MNISLEDMKSYIQEWFAQALGFDDLREIYAAVRFEADKQFEYIANKIAKEKSDNGCYED